MRRLCKIDIINDPMQLVEETVEHQVPFSLEDKIKRNHNPGLSRLRNNPLTLLDVDQSYIEGPLDPWNKK